MCTNNAFAPVGASQHLGPVSDDEGLGELAAQLPPALGAVGLSLNTAHRQFLHKETEGRNRWIFLNHQWEVLGRFFFFTHVDKTTAVKNASVLVTNLVTANFKSQQRRHLLLLLLTSSQ